jgi:hypothetical protein
MQIALKNIWVQSATNYEGNEVNLVDGDDGDDRASPYIKEEW